MRLPMASSPGRKRFAQDSLTTIASQPWVQVVEARAIAGGKRAALQQRNSRSLEVTRVGAAIERIHQLTRRQRAALD